MTTLVKQRLEEVEIVERIQEMLYNLGLEWSLGPKTLLHVLKYGIPDFRTFNFDVAVCKEDLTENVKHRLTELGLFPERVFKVPYRGFTSRCIYVLGLPCIVIEDILLSISMSDVDNVHYNDVVTQLLQVVNLDSIDRQFLKIMCTRLNVCDKLRQIFPQVKI